MYTVSSAIREVPRRQIVVSAEQDQGHRVATIHLISNSFSGQAHTEATAFIPYEYI